MRELQLACQRHDERDVGVFADGVVFGGGRDHGYAERAGRDAACEGRVEVDVELEGVVPVVADVDRAVCCLFDAKVEFERALGLEACREGDVGEMAIGIGDVLALAGVC